MRLLRNGRYKPTDSCETVKKGARATVFTGHMTYMRDSQGKLLGLSRKQSSGECCAASQGAKGQVAEHRVLWGLWCSADQAKVVLDPTSPRQHKKRLPLQPQYSKQQACKASSCKNTPNYLGPGLSSRDGPARGSKASSYCMRAADDCPRAFHRDL